MDEYGVNFRAVHPVSMENLYLQSPEKKVY